LPLKAILENKYYLIHFDAGAQLYDAFFIVFIVEKQVSSKQEVVDALVKEQFSVDVARV
jgi:hypothetical protein